MVQYNIFTVFVMEWVLKSRTLVMAAWRGMRKNSWISCNGCMWHCQHNLSRYGTSSKFVTGCHLVWLVLLLVRDPRSQPEAGQLFGRVLGIKWSTRQHVMEEKAADYWVVNYVSSEQCKLALSKQPEYPWHAHIMKPVLMMLQQRCKDTLSPGDEG